MNHSDKLIRDYKINADKRISFMCRIMIGFMILVTILNMLDIFIIKPIPLYTVAIITVVMFFIPTLLHDILKIHNTQSRIIVLFIVCFVCAMLYSVLSYHAILMLIFPVVLACLYNKPKYVIYAMMIMSVFIIIAHLIALELGVVPDEPLVTLKTVILFGILPREIEFLALSVGCYFISSRIDTLSTTLVNKNNELYDDQDTIIASFSEIIESRTKHTGKHIKRVSEYVKILCKAKGYDDETTWKISKASMMHDVGKIGVPIEIIEKKGKLSDNEYEIIKTHTKIGNELLKNAPGELFKISSIIALEHHEKWDGTGYFGLKGEEIDEVSRLVILADVFDALVSNRPYKGAWDPKDAYNEIVSQSGKHFDPMVVDLFIKNFDKFVEISNKYPNE